VLLGSHVAPLWATYAFMQWRSTALAVVAAERGGGSGGSFGTGSGDSLLDNGLGFPDLLVAMLLCALLPALLANTRWVVYAIDPFLATSSLSTSQGGASGETTFEARFLDAAVAVNTLVCRVLLWPFMLLMYHRFRRGGLREPDEATAYGGGGGIVEEVPFVEAILDALLTLPLRCSLGTLCLFLVSVYSFQKDARRALAFRPRSSGTDERSSSSYKDKNKGNSRTNDRSSSSSFSSSNESSSSSGGSCDTGSNYLASRRPPKLLSNLERGGDFTDPKSPMFPPNGYPLRSNNFDKQRNDDDDLPPALLRLASTPEEVEWLRAQKRISNALKEQKYREEAKSDSDNGPLRPVVGGKWE